MAKKEVLLLIFVNYSRKLNFKGERKTTREKKRKEKRKGKVLGGKRLVKVMDFSEGRK